MITEILVTSMTILAAGLGYVIKEQREKITKIKSQLSDKKYILYHEIYSIFFDIFKQQKGFKEEKKDELAIRLIDVKKDLFIYAPDNIVKKFIEWNTQINTSQGDIRHFSIFLDLFILIRKDMGNAKTTITKLDVLRSIMISDADYEELKKLLGL